MPKRIIIRVLSSDTVAQLVEELCIMHLINVQTQAVSDFTFRHCLLFHMLPW